MKTSNKNYVSEQLQTLISRFTSTCIQFITIIPSHLYCKVISDLCQI